MEIFSTICMMCTKKENKEKKDGLKREYIRKIYYTKLRLTHNFEYDSEEEEQTDKKANKKTT